MNLTIAEPLKSLSSASNAAITSSYTFTWSTYHYFFLLFVLICIFSAVFGNGLVILSWCLDQSIRTPSNALLVSLAVPDFLVGIISIPFLAIYELSGDWIFGESVCNFWLVMLWTAGFVSSNHLVLIAVDRYRILMEGVQYLHRQTFKSIILPIFFVWFAGFSITLPMIIDWKETGDYHFRNTTAEQQWVCRTKTSTIRVIYTNFTVVLLPGMVLLTIYAKIFIELQKRFRRKLNNAGESTDANVASKTSQSMEETTIPPAKTEGAINEGTNGSSSDSSIGASVSSKYGSVLNHISDRKRLEYMEKERRAAKTLGLLILAFILCWTPYFTVSVLRVTKLASNHVLGRTIPLISALLGWFNSCVNPMIYAKRNHDFQRAFKRTIRIITFGVFCKR